MDNLLTTKQILKTKVKLLPLLHYCVELKSENKIISFHYFLKSQYKLMQVFKNYLTIQPAMFDNNSEVVFS